MSVAGPEIIPGTVAATTATAGMSAFSVFLALLVPALVLWYVYFRVSQRHVLELAEKIPGPPGYPLIGNALEFMGSSDSEF